jgi:mycothiol synthase
MSTVSGRSTHICGAARRTVQVKQRGVPVSVASVSSSARRIEVVRTPTDADVASIVEVLDAAAAADGQWALSDHHWLDLTQGDRQGFTGLIAAEPGHHHAVGYAQVSRANHAWGIEMVIHPHHRLDGADIAPELIHEAITAISEAGGGHVHWWVFEPTRLHERVAHDAGLSSGRTLLQMRCPLPLDVQATIATRRFAVGRDEAAWLAVNNRAFGDHPEQGGWTLDTLAAREQEPWFDPRGFRLHEVDGELVGFCWTKIHHGLDPVVGEIYVIAVDPSAHGRGLGRELTLAGLDSIAGRGVHTAMLYVDADNVAARTLYESLGFTVHQTHRAFIGEVTAD